MNEPASPTRDARRAQMFPVLAADEIAHMRRFGELRRFADGARVFETGKPSVGIQLVLSGTIRVTGRDGHGHDFPVVDHGPGSFSGEVSQLSGKPSFVDGVALGDTETIEINTGQLHALLIAEAALGEKIMRAMILRRVALIEAGAGGPVLISAESSPDVARLRSFLSRNGIPHLLLDPANDADARAFIERYAPAPDQLPLAGRAYTQAQKFGARMLIPMELLRLDCERSAEGEPMLLQLADGRAVRSRSVVIATGARYRRPECTNLKAMEGRGVWYWASPIEARMCAGEEVVLVGGGNSAGPAAVFLSAHAAKVWMLVRGPGLAASMSQYLIDRIAATPNIELLTRTEITGLTGSRQSGVESVTWRSRDSANNETRPIRHVFMFLGADPSTEWLKDCDVAVDDKGFVTTAHDAALPLQTSVPGVFAIGDVRAGSVKRVGGAIGEGAAVVAQIHSFLSRASPTVPAALPPSAQSARAARESDPASSAAY